ncbi:MAG: protein-arginine deiminase family protein [Planctomycetota bacterium]
MKRKRSPFGLRALRVVGVCVTLGMTCCVSAQSSSSAWFGGWLTDADRSGTLNVTADVLQPNQLNETAWSWARGGLIPVGFGDADEESFEAGRVALVSWTPPISLIARSAGPWQVRVDTRGGASVPLRVWARAGVGSVDFAQDGWAPVGPNGVWSGRAGVTLAVQATRLIEAGEDGRVRLVASRVEGEQTREATAELRVAPFVLAAGLQSAELVVVRAVPERNEAMVADLRRIVEKAGAELHVIPGDAPYPRNHVWVQDAVEFGHVWTGRPDAAHVAMPSNRDRGLDLFAADRLLDRGLRVIRVGDYRPDFASGVGGPSWLDWYGNLEATPGTEQHPLGLAIYGVDPVSDASLNPDVVAFLEAQGAQPTLGLDVGWLQIKHVDELVSFVPAGPTRADGTTPFAVVMPDPDVALRVLEQLVADGYGDAALFTPFEDGATPATLLADEAFVAHNRALRAEWIEPAIARLCSALGVPMDEVIRLPGLFNPNGSARMPNVVNALLVNGHYIMSDPAGPDLPGGDPFKAAIRAALADYPVTPHFVDDRLYHRWSGNVHCATNAIRRPAAVVPAPPSASAVP